MTRMMGHTILVGDIPIEVTRKRIKHVHLRVRPPNGDVTISAPMSARLQVVEAFAATRLEWIRRQQERLRGLPRETPRRFATGESHYLWGRRHLLVVVERRGRQGVELNDRRMMLFVRPGSNVAGRARAIFTWHKAILGDTLPPLIRGWEQRLNVRVKGFHLRRMKTRWGTCNYRTKHIRLNTELVTKSAHLFEYVLVHEMVHLIVPDHGSRFVALMNEHYPSWRDARAELNESAVEAS
ncbi:MAG TPA: SprT family zinc-dependent metalloprotease [Gemmatimonadaceae bacterium]